MTVYALIPAAGKSVRMGAPKLSLPLGTSTVLERVATALRQGGVERLLIVTRTGADDVRALAARADAEVALLPADTPDMRATVQYGLRHLQERYAPTDADALLLCPADHPTLDAGVVHALRAALDARPEHSIFVPAYEGKRGHPLLVRWRHVPGMLAVPPGRGLDSYLRAHARERFELPWTDPAILRDLDTPEDYARLLEEQSAARVRAESPPAAAP
jgi:molybdenum cofactor cytidylyltransferase